MKKIIILSIIAVIALAAGVFADTRSETARPNVVLIIIDTLRADTLGSYGFPDDISPEIDKMAYDGVRFMNVIAPSSWTRTSIGSIITAKHPRSIGLYVEKYDSIHDKHVTLAESLKAAGYNTYGITANPTINSVFNYNQGFDEYVDSDSVWFWMDFDKGKKLLSKGRLDKLDIPLADAPYVFNNVLEYAKSKTAGSSYVQINIMEVHEYRKLIRPEFSGEFKHVDKMKERDYYTTVKQVSHDIGLFVEQLTSMPGWDNTLFIITSDHGEGLNDHPSVVRSIGHGNLLYESNLKVPMIWYKASQKSLLPGPAGQLSTDPYSLDKMKITQRVRLMDLYPTLLDYLDINKPNDLDGISLISLMRDSSASVPMPDYFFAETYFKGNNKIAVYSDKWKYIENRDGHRGLPEFELQPVNIKEKGSATNMSGIKKKITASMKAVLTEWEEAHPQIARTSAKEDLRKEEIQQLKSLGYLD